MPRSLGPADSSSQVSSNYGRGRAYGDGSRGSMLGRPPATGSNPHAPPHSNIHAHAHVHFGQGSTHNRPPSAGGYSYGGGAPGSMLGRQPTGSQTHARRSTRPRSNVGLSDANLHHHNSMHGGYQTRAPTSSTIMSGYSGRHGNGRTHGPPPMGGHHTGQQGRGYMQPIREDSVVGSAPMDPGHPENGYQHSINHGHRSHRGSVASRAMVPGPESVREASPPPPDDEEYFVQKRSVPVTWRSTHHFLIEELCEVFKVKRGKVKDWIEDGLIRVDLKNWKEERMPYNIDPLLAQLAPKDIERWDRMVRGCDNSRKYAKSIGPSGGSYSDFAQGREPRSASGVLKAGYDRRCFLCWFEDEFCGERYHRDFFDR